MLPPARPHVTLPHAIHNNTTKTFTHARAPFAAAVARGAKEAATPHAQDKPKKTHVERATTKQCRCRLNGLRLELRLERQDTLYSDKTSFSPTLVSRPRPLAHVSHRHREAEATWAGSRVNTII